MTTSAAPTLRGLASRSSSGSSDPDLDECFHSLWHYNCVLSPQSAQQLLNSPAQTSVAFTTCSPIGGPLCDLSRKDQSFLAEGFASPLSRHRLRPLFRMLDKNNDGKVSLDEIMCVLRKLGKEGSQSCLISLLKPLVHGGDMAVDFAEFIALYHSICSTDSDTNTQEEATRQADAEFDSGELLDTFNVYDKNRDGYICAAELAEVLRDLGCPEGRDLQKCQTLIDGVDTDGNGLVDLGEFKEMLCRRCGISETPVPLGCESEATTERPKLGQLFEVPPYRRILSCGDLTFQARPREQVSRT